MKRKLSIIFAALLLLAMGSEACARTQNHDTMKGKKVLVAFFSRADENYAVGTVEKGNTQFVAEEIARRTGGELFRIESVAGYPADYKACVEVAKRELEQHARPEIEGDAAVEACDVIFLGYPNWWGELPMAVYTFIEKHDWRGKIVLPFCTHEGSGLSATERSVANACAGATVGKGLALRGLTAQNDRVRTAQAVEAWLQKVIKNE